MQLHVSPTIPRGELPAFMNPGSNSPFGIVSFGDVDLHLNSDEDCDRLIRAAVRVKAMRATLGMPHVFAAAGSDYHCEACGMLDNWKDHLAPVLEGTVTAPPQDAPYAEVLPAVCGDDAGTDGGVSCTLPAGHDGRHEDHRERGVFGWPRETPVGAR